MAVSVFVLSLLLYGNTLNNGYNLDDELVTNGHRLTSKGLTAIPEILRSPYYMDGMGYSYEYRPVAHISFAIEHGLFGENPKVSHFINLLLYAFTGFIVLLVSGRLFQGYDRTLPWLITALFIAYPLHVEPVASIKNREDLLAFLGGMLALYSMLRWFRSNGFVWFVVMFMFLGLGLLSKLSALSFLLILPVVAVFNAPRERSLGIITLSCLLILGGVLSVRTTMSPGSVGTVLAILLSMVLTLRLVRAGSPLKLIFSHVHGGWTSLTSERPDSLAPGKDDLKKTLALMFLSGGLQTYAMLYDSLPQAVLGSLLLFLHPLILARFNRLLFTAGVVSITPLSVLSGSDIWFLPFYITAVSITAVHIHLGAEVRRHLAINHLLVSAGLVFASYWKDYEVLSTLSRLLVISMVIMPAYVSRSPLRSRFVLATLAYMVCVVTISAFKGFKFHLLLTSALIPLLLLSESRPWVRRTVLLLLLILPSVAVYVRTPSQTIEAPVLLEAQTTNPSPAARPVLYDWLGVTADRPLTRVEYPLGVDADLSEKIGTGSIVMMHYLKLMVVPWPQSFYYGYSVFDRTKADQPEAIASILILMVVLSVTLIGLALGSIWGLGLLITMVSLAQFSNVFEPVAGMAGDRLTYVASFGFCIALGHLIVIMYKRTDSLALRRIVWACVGTTLILWTGMTVARNSQWKDPLTLMSRDIEYVGESAQANYLLGLALMRESMSRNPALPSSQLQLKAIVHLRKAAGICPEYLNYWHDLGKAYRDMGNLRSALPCFMEAHRLDTTFYDACFNVAMIADELGDHETAIDHYERCIRNSPHMLQAYTNLSYLHFRSKDFARSIEVNERALSFNPGWRDPYQNIATAYIQMQQPDKAAYYIEQLKGR